MVTASGAPPTRERLSSFLAHLFVVGVWILAFKLLAEHGVRLLPLSLARQLTLQNYLTIVQIATAAFGLAVSFLMLQKPREALGLTRTTATRIGVVLLLAPAIYVLASYLAIYVALGTLLEELARGGRQAAQQNTGQFGRELTQSGVFAAILWGVVVSPISEELLFRGALYSLGERAIGGVAFLVSNTEPAPSPESAPPSSAAELGAGMLTTSITLDAVRALGRFARVGAGPTLISASVFTYMHMDTPGGLGIVRWVSALGLGLATGATRYASGSIFGAMALHMAFNFYSLAAARRWVVTETFPMKLGVPTLLSAVAVLSALIALVWMLLARQRAKAA